MNLSRRFRVDARRFVERLNSILLALESDPGRTDLVHEAFRHVHSLKSEAAMLHLTGVVQATHEVEGILASIRQRSAGPESSPGVSAAVTAEEINSLFRQVDAIQEHVVNAVAAARKSSESVFGDDRTPPAAEQSTGLLSFDDFELVLLEEAAEREERLYRMVCEIEEDAPLKYAKAYLLINNLEQLVHVVRVVPALSAEVDDDDLFRTIRVAFTSNSDEADIYAAVNVDQVSRVEMVSLDIHAYVGKREGEAEENGEHPPSVSAESGDVDATAEVDADRNLESPVNRDIPKAAGESAGEDSSVTVRTAKIDELLGYVDELKIGLRGMANRLERQHHEEHPAVTALETLTAGIEDVIREFRLVRLDDEFVAYPRLLRDMARDLGKQLEIQISGGEVVVDRRILDLVSSPLRHLLRNAVDHGIETAEERRSAGKAPTGRISVSAALDGDTLHVQVEDDGRGITIKETDGRAGSLLDVITAPGYSSKKEAGEISGRGVGLDSVRETVESSPGGKLRLETESGKGTTFEIIIPRSYTLVGFLLVTAGELTVAVPKQNIEGVIRLESGRIAQRGDGVFWTPGPSSGQFTETDRFPVFTVNGRVFIADGPPSEETALLVSHLGRRGIMLVSEVLYEQEYPKSHVEIVGEASPYLHRMRIDGRDVDYLSLDPALISS
jgi:two-component system, chemotaxis family, sensor kinase CheA